MIATEERLRAATRAAAATVPPGSAPPLRLPDEPVRRPGRAHGNQHRRRWLRAMTPLAAAAAVAGVVIASLLLTSPTPPGGPAGPASGTSALRSVPPYYVAIAGLPDTPQHAVVRASATGTVLATVKPPRPYGSFTFVSGAADDRTFVLAAQRWWRVTSGIQGAVAQQRDNTTPVVFFRLRFDPRARTAQLTRLSRVAGPQAEQLAGIGVSPDGSRLAIAQHTAEIRVVTLAAGCHPFLRHLGRQCQTRRPAALLGRRRTDPRLPVLDPVRGHHAGAPARHHRTGRQPARDQARRQLRRPWPGQDRPDR
jgi:hypothetical protein